MEVVYLPNLSNSSNREEFSQVIYIINPKNINNYLIGEEEKAESAELSHPPALRAANI